MSTHDDITGASHKEVSANKYLLAGLKTRENWVCWRYEERDEDKPTKVPVNPNTGSYASSSDSSTWTDYETAVEFAESNSKADGIGVVFGSDDLLAGVDLDNVRDPETGELEPWAEDIIERLDSYTEVSPSGTGIHVLVFGILPDDARTREKQESTLEAYDEAEVEMYDSGRFFTVSFDHVESTPSQVIQRNDELRGVHEEYVAREDDDEQDETMVAEPGETEPDLDDQEIIEKAKNAENGREFERLWNGVTSMHDGDHSRADMALLSHLAFWTQCDPTRMERLFEKSGLCRDKWTEREDYRERSIEKAITGCSEVYQPPESEPDDSSTIPPIAPTNLIERHGGYYQAERTEDDVKYHQVTNFTLEAKAFVLDEHGDEHVELEVNPASTVEDAYEVVVPWTVFNEVRKFKNHVVIGRTTAYSGTPSQLNELRLIVSHQGAPKLQKTTKIGLHDDEIVTADGVVGTEDPQYRHVQQGTAMETKFNLENITDYDDEEVAEILELLPETRDKERLLPVLGWWYASLFTPKIREWEGELPFAGVFGETGSGKTSLLQTLSQMVGMDPNPASARTTKFSLIQHFAATTNIPLWIDEYKPSDIEQWRLDTLHDYIRKATRGADETRGNADKSEERYTFEAPVLVSGEQVIQGNAENRRMIPIQLRKDSTKGETAQNWMRLTGGSVEKYGSITHYDGYDLSEHARAIWAYILDLDDEEAREVWEAAKEDAFEAAHEEGVDDLEALEINAITMVKFGLAVYQHFADIHGGDPEFSDEDVQTALQYLLGNSGQDSRTSHVDEFLSLASSAVRDGQAGPDQFRVINKDDPDEELLVKVNTMHHKVRKYVREHDISTDVFDSPQDYKDRFRELADDDSSYVNEVGKIHRDLNRCVAIDMERAEEEVDGFDRAAFAY